MPTSKAPARAGTASKPSGRRRILVVDVGGSNVKVLAPGWREPRKLPSGRAMTPRDMVRAVRKLTRDTGYDVMSIGFPGPVFDDRPYSEPRNLGDGWVGFDFGKAFGKPVRVVNDAAMQALGSYRGGRMLFLGLGTGLGSALIVDGVLEPMELAHLPYKRGRTYEDYVGKRGLRRLGKRRWRRAVADVVGRLRAALMANYVVIGGGNAKHLAVLPRGAKRGDNALAFRGGRMLWTGTDLRRSRH